MSPQPRLLHVLNILSALLLAAGTLMVFWYAPVERVMGAVQKLFYFHVATAWVGMIGFIIAAVVAILYLVTKDLKWDAINVAAVEISLVFFFIAIVLGSIWARPAWGTWWTWEPRLTTAAILEMIYLAYLLLRQGIEDPERRARFGAVYTIFGGLSVPLTFVSIRLFRTIHPVIIGAGGSEKMNMTGDMVVTMLFNIAVFSVIFITLFWHRIRLGQFAEQVERRKLQLTH
ncbi:MAG: cytochrome c biogenesis protein [Anaerolineales bacterium]|nr:cytochrome c biogenesis protein [Anaerolineales bacterium]MCX7755058.1 cytochrome c biogenesis protein [Anaerolineales bacterium]MDW8277621.1 cytochrome c biogenesis protein CcsA [Anaerolineales bacterium]